MEWFYSLNDQRQGPVSETQLAALVQQGVVTNTTLVWRQGMKDWEPYSSTIHGSAPEDYRRCGECGKVHPQADMIEYNKVWICAECKPTFIQKLQEGVNPANRTIWRSGKRLIMNRNATLPMRCIKCNEPAEDGVVKKVVYYVPPLYYLIILLSILIFIIVALIVQKKASVTYCLCRQHRTQRRRSIGITVAMLVGAFVMFGLAVYLDNGGFVAGGLLLLLSSLLFGIFTTRTIYARKIDGDLLTLGGFCPQFLAEFPEWTGQS